MTSKRPTSNYPLTRARATSATGTLNRTTIFLPEVMTANLDCLALQIGESKATIVRHALANYMQTYGYDPYRKPKITVSHR
jgi:hypothetical protein